MESGENRFPLAKHKRLIKINILKSSAKRVERGASSMPTLSLDITQQGAQITRGNNLWSDTLGTAATVNFGFRATAPTTGTEGPTFSQFTTAEMAATRIALQEFSDVANIKFTDVAPSGYTDAATMLFANYRGPATSAGHAYFPTTKDTTPTSPEGDTWLNLTASPFTALGFGKYDFLTIAHEIGHAIGLDHPGDYNAGDGGGAITYATSATYIQDTRQWSIMSYFQASDGGANHTTPDGTVIYSSTPLLADIAAAQRLYGVNTTTRTGDNTYGFNSNAGAQYNIAPGQDVVFCIYDAGGTNTLDVSGYSTNQNINLNQGAFSDVGNLTKNISIALGTVIQRAIAGSGNDAIVMNDNGDRVTGGGGNDTITGGKGIDTAIYTGTAASHTVTRNGAAITIADQQAGRDGTDTLTNVERAQFSDVTLAFDLTGDAGQGYRLYKAAFNRTPDQGGVSFWINNLDKGMTLKTVAQAFVDSAEYKSIYGTNPTADTIVGSFYGNVLGRTPDQSGLNFWINTYKAGMSTADLLVNFSESAENQASTIAVVGNGITLTTSAFG